MFHVSRLGPLHTTSRNPSELYLQIGAEMDVLRWTYCWSSSLKQAQGMKRMRFPTKLDTIQMRGDDEYCTDSWFVSLDGHTKRERLQAVVCQVPYAASSRLASRHLICTICCRALLIDALVTRPPCAICAAKASTNMPQS